MSASHPLGFLPRYKKRNSTISVPFHKACGTPQNTSYYPVCLYPDNKKSAKRLPCFYMVSLTLHTILDNVCLRLWFSMPEPAPPALMIMPYIYHSLTAGTHKNQLQRNLSTISCILSTHSYNIYSSLFYSL